MLRRLILGCLLAAALSGCGGDPSGEPGTVVLYAAMSLRVPLLEARSLVEEAAGSAITFNFGASDNLARQILAARQADLFLSADQLQMDRVERAGLVEPGTRIAFLSNRLVVIVPVHSALDVARPEDLTSPEIGRLCVPNPSGVPAGVYARGWLEGAGLWDRIEDRVVPALDVRAALAAVESGGVQAGIIYRTDAALSRKVRVVYEVPAADGPEILYAAAAISGRRALPQARSILEILRGEEARSVFESYGFTAVERGSPPGAAR
jgi:molybdate transport system substrate-binding protein